MKTIKNVTIFSNVNVGGISVANLIEGATSLNLLFVDNAACVAARAASKKSKYGLGRELHDWVRRNPEGVLTVTKVSETPDWCECQEEFFTECEEEIIQEVVEQIVQEVQSEQVTEEEPVVEAPTEPVVEKTAEVNTQPKEEVNMSSMTHQQLLEAVNKGTLKDVCIIDPSIMLNSAGKKNGSIYRVKRSYTEVIGYVRPWVVVGGVLSVQKQLVSTGIKAIIKECSSLKEGKREFNFSALYVPSYMKVFVEEVVLDYFVQVGVEVVFYSCNKALANSVFIQKLVEQTKERIARNRY